MFSLFKLNRIVVAVIAMFMISCGGNSKAESNDLEVSKSKNLASTKCDKIIEDYDNLISKSIELTMAGINGEEIEQAEQEKLRKEGEALAKKIQSMGVVGLGGQHCYDEFVKIQLKWSEAFVELQQKAMEEAMKKLENN